MSFADWRAYFERNRTKTYPDPAADLDRIPAAWIPLLRSTLARLQAGETGEGRVIAEVRAHGLGDADYHASVAMFVAEEGRHARILGQALKGLGGEPLRASWTESSFRWARRRIGVRTKLVVLMSAEVVAISFYGALADALPPCALRAALDAIGDDEVAHKAFHAALFRSETTTPARRALFRAAWWCAAAGSCAVVTADHWRTLRALDVDVPAMLAEMVRLVAEADADVLSPERAPAPPLAAVA